MIFVTLQSFIKYVQQTMTLEELKAAARKLIGRARMKEAIDQIINWAEKNQREELRDEMSLLKGNLAGLESEKRLGLLSSSESSVRQNKINYSVLSSLDNIEEDNPVSSNPGGNNPGGINPVIDSPDGKSLPVVLKILMLTANPANTTKLNLDKEYATLSQKLQQRQKHFNIIWERAISGTEFKEFTQKEKPHILHFSGHGEGGKYAGIVVQNDEKNGEELIQVKGLKSLFKLFKKKFNIKVVLLNACYTEEQAATISAYVDYVIGTNVAIGNPAARAFSSGFYFQLANDTDMNIEDAFDSGRTEAVMKGADEENFVIYRHGELINVE